MRSIINILQNDSALVALLGDANQIGMNFIKQGKKTPYVVVDVEDRTTTNTFREASDLDFVRFTVFSVADRSYTNGSVIGADEIGKAVRNAIDYVAAGTYDGETITRCTLERGGQMQEDRIANKTQITREDEYLLSVRP